MTPQGLEMWPLGIRLGSHVLIVSTFLQQGPSILEPDEQKKGLLPRVLDALFECMKKYSSVETTKHSVKLSMVSRRIFNMKLARIL